MAHIDLAALDAFMAAQKRVEGTDTPPRWGTGFVPRERQMKYPLSLAGELIGAQLMVVCFPQTPWMFRLGILAPGCLCRLDFTDETHPNALAAQEDNAQPFVTGPHYHSWALNRRFFHGVATPPRLHLAVAFDAASSFDAILRWFCTDTSIESLPSDHRIELPKTGQLL